VAKGFTTVLKYKNKLKAFVDRVVELDPQFFHGAGDRGLGAFYAKAPSFAGGDLGKAHQHFTRSLEIAPNYFGTKLLIAEYYATKKQDKTLYTKILQEVLAADPKVIPEIAPEQMADQVKAQRLLDLTEDKFAD
jgi:tetratricopeptide (TPR) repeat protein